MLDQLVVKLRDYFPLKADFDRALAEVKGGVENRTPAGIVVNLVVNQHLDHG